MEYKLESKHHEKKLSRKEVKLQFSIQLKMSLSLTMYSLLLNRFNIAIKSRVKVIKLRPGTKMCNLNKRHGIDKLTKPPKNVIHNFAPYDLT